MRTIAIIVGALLIAGSILIVGRYQIDHMTKGSKSYVVWGLDTWTGEPFVKQRAYPASLVHD